MRARPGCRPTPSRGPARPDAGRRCSVSGSSRRDAEPGRDLPYDAAPRHRQDAGLPEHRLLLHRLAEAEDVAHDDRLVVGRVVGDLLHPDLVDALRERGQRQRQHVVGEPRVDAVDVQARVPGLSRLGDPLEHLRRQDPGRPLQQHRAARHHVDPGLDEPDQVLDRLEDPVVGHRGVHDRVRPQGEQRVPVGGGARPRARGRGRRARRRPCRPWRGRTPRPRPARGRDAGRCRRSRAGRRCRWTRRPPARDAVRRWMVSGPSSKLRTRSSSREVRATFGPVLGPVFGLAEDAGA